MHWTTPSDNPIRFATWFFMAAAPVSDVNIDHGEIIDHRWLTPQVALDAQREGRMLLAAPTFSLTTRLRTMPNVDTALAAVATWPDERIVGRLHDVPGGRVALYTHVTGSGWSTQDGVTNGIFEWSRTSAHRRLRAANYRRSGRRRRPT